MVDFYLIRGGESLNVDDENFTIEGKKAILKKLIEAEGFENYCHTKFVGTKRFA